MKTIRESTGHSEKRLLREPLFKRIRRRRLGIWVLLAGPWTAGVLFSQTVTLVQQNEIAAGRAPVSFAIGDFNGDGRLDVAVADQNSASVMVLLGIGSGFFTPLINQEVGSGPVAIVTGDFNGDGILDLVVANRVSNSVLLLLGNGNGTFRPFTTLPATGPSALAVGDFNADGKLDFAVANANSNTVSVWLGNGDGTFRGALDFGVGATPVSIAVGDFNGDGDPDLAVANLNSANVSVLLGTGTGIFLPILNASTGSSPVSVALGDFNDDGKLDVAVVNGGVFMSAVSVLLGNGNGTFQPPLSFQAGENSSFLVVADLNNDGKLDLVVADTGSNSISVLLGYGNGLFQIPLSFPVGSGPAWIGLIDFSASGQQDLIVANSFSDNLSVLLNLTPVIGLPIIAADSVVNATSYATGPIAPGEMVTVFGSNLGPKQPTGLQLNTSGLVATTLSQTQVRFDGIAAPLISVSADQVSAMVPYGLAAGQNVQVVVQHDSVVSPSMTVPLASSAPGLFTVNAVGTGPGVVLNQDQSVNSADNPAAQGSTVVLFGTGAGQTDPPGIDGELANNILPKPLLAVSVTIDGKNAQVSYAGAAPGLVAGILQVNVQLPDGIRTGAVPVVLRVDGAVSQSGVTLSIK